ncbi:2-hydroxyacid dehydrogenase [Ruegeria sp. 2205SS24-7]|uniref:2-hydroxyacid dehydrogenase n=1 Tax=Ruegeria discodermiae TaxID=3064389 RepID=UPI0027425B23|nr:2-hydroxyacid dehydrogenase [Ruegeria sp. 2205SS24-7]MDP5218005.1 2-hydroxyacid dehydrogenase [Ruegeria sp. 2205SS24-7]
MSDLLVLAPLTEHMRALLDADFTLHHVSDMADPQLWLDKNGAGIRYVLTDGHLGLPAAYLNTLPALELISSNGVGYDAIDTDAVVERGVLVTHTPDVLNEEVASTALLLYLSCYRNWEAQMAQARTGRWQTEGELPLAQSADGRTVGILGLGRIGMAIARKLEAFGCTICYTARARKDVGYAFYDDLVKLAHSVDALICVIPGGAATRHMVNAEVIAALGPQGVLINVGRGSVVDEAALVVALQEGHLGWAGLDVFENEPHIPHALRAHPRAILTPHIGSATVETRAAMGQLAAENLLLHKRSGRVKSPVPECASLL